MPVQLDGDHVANDLVARLEAMDASDTPSFANEIMREAADELETLHVQISELREALKPFAIAAQSGEMRYALLKAGGVGVMDRCDGFIDVAKRHLSVSNFRASLTALEVAK